MIGFLLKAQNPGAETTRLSAAGEAGHGPDQQTQDARPAGLEAEDSEWEDPQSCHEGVAAGPHRRLPEDGFPWRVEVSGPGGRHEVRVDTQDPTQPPQAFTQAPRPPPAETRGR